MQEAALTTLDGDVVVEVLPGEDAAIRDVGLIVGRELLLLAERLVLLAFLQDPVLLFSFRVFLGVDGV